MNAEMSVSPFDSSLLPSSQMQLMTNVTTSLVTISVVSSSTVTTSAVPTSSLCTSVTVGPLSRSYPGLSHAHGIPVAATPSPFLHSLTPVLRDAVPSPAWMSESGLSAEDEQVILDHLGSSIRVSTRKCPLQIVQLLKML